MKFSCFDFLCQHLQFSNNKSPKPFLRQKPKITGKNVNFFILTSDINLFEEKYSVQSGSWNFWHCFFEKGTQNVFLAAKFGNRQNTPKFKTVFFLT